MFSARKLHSTSTLINVIVILVTVFSLFGSVTTTASANGGEPPNPSFGVWVSNGTIGGWGWPGPIDTLVTVTIDDGDPLTTNYSGTAPIVDLNKGGQLGFNLNLPDDVVLIPGYIVTVTDGTTPKDTKVTALAVIGVDADTDIVSGVADPGKVDAWICDEKSCANRHVIADEFGDWSANFYELGSGDDEQTQFDIVPGTKGDAMQKDIDGDGTMAGFYVPELTFTISGNTVVAGVSLDYTDGSPQKATSDDGGNYSFIVSYDWSGTVTPSLEGYTFSPTSLNYFNVKLDQPGQNYIAAIIVPINLQASDGSYTNKNLLTWDPVSGATFYKVSRATTSGGTKTLLGSPISTTFTDITATPGLTYYYWVRACISTECSDFSIHNTGWRQLSAPANLQSSDGNFTDKVLLTWKASIGATSYNVYRATSSGGAKTLLGSPTTVTYTDTTATPGLIYYYWVKACRGSRCSIYSTANSGWKLLSAPINLLASDGTFTGKVLLTWTASSGATSYNVYRATSSGGAKTLLGSPAVATYADTTATPGVTYYYWVKTCTGIHCSIYSTANTGWRMLSAPTNLQASDGTYTTKVQLSWTASSGATSYKIYRATSSGGTKSLLGNPTTVNFADTSTTPGVTYYYWVIACRNTRCSVYSIANTGWRKP